VQQKNLLSFLQGSFFKIASSNKTITIHSPTVLTGSVIELYNTQTPETSHANVYQGLSLVLDMDLSSSFPSLLVGLGSRDSKKKDYTGVYYFLKK
jgi:hypothetical protein